ncbi:MAG: hypothetical protein HKN82_03510, partial [Akkermansiaceae bacterium]|nr:hypothetical protein [Akkermansiaceae bacterium]
MPRSPLSTPLVAAAVAMAIFASPVCAQLGTGKLVARQIVSGLARPVFVTAPSGDTGRLFIVERYVSTGSTGRLRIYDHATQTLLATPFLQIPGVNTGFEEGLLGLAFHPNYAANGHFYVYFSDTNGPRLARIVRYTADAPYATSNTADPGSGVEVLRVTQPQANHNGGWIGFNPVAVDNGMTTGNPRHYLYIGTGDGGGGNDDDGGHTAGLGNGQDITDNLLGKILRLDTGADGNADAFAADALRNYAIPPDNPFVGRTGDDEIWSYGLRNPWRCSFDRLTGDFWIADVGQDTREEVDFQPASDFTSPDPLAANYGWRHREGDIATPGVGGTLPAALPARDGIPAGQFAPGTSGLVEPVLDYPQVTDPSPEFQTDNGSQLYGWSLTGGCVYRGSMKWLQGAYFFGDFASNRFYAIRHNGTSLTASVEFGIFFNNLDVEPGGAA